MTSVTDWTSDIAPFLFIAGPTDPLYERFKKDFEFIPINELRLWEWPVDNHAQPFTFLVNRAVDVRAWAERHLITGSFGRDDYRELCELVVHFLGGQV